jgi:hypothetical protein
MDALGSQIQAVEAEVRDSRQKLTAQAASIEAQLSRKLDDGLKGLDTSVASALSQSRGEVEKKMSGDVASLRSEIAQAKGASDAAADKLHAKVSAVTTATEAAMAAQQAQVDTVAKAHADFEAHATTTLARVKDSLSTTKVLPVYLLRCLLAWPGDAQRAEGKQQRIFQRAHCLRARTVRKVLGH